MTIETDLYKVGYRLDDWVRFGSTITHQKEVNYCNDGDHYRYMELIHI